jgi:hypothetical protein
VKGDELCEGKMVKGGGGGRSWEARRRWEEEGRAPSFARLHLAAAPRGAAAPHVHFA